MSGPGNALGPGLCADCCFHRVVESGRGARFWLCRRSRYDTRFPRYPRLPVLACAGYRAVVDAAGSDEDEPMDTQPEGP